MCTSCAIMHLRCSLVTCIHLQILNWRFTHVVFFALSVLTDIEECESELHACNCKANCTDTDGSFNCTCREGFEVNGFNCTGTQLHKHCMNHILLLFNLRIIRYVESLHRLAITTFVCLLQTVCKNYKYWKLRFNSYYTEE